jgi:sugar phosphate isomerase/epimerase
MTPITVANKTLSTPAPPSQSHNQSAAGLETLLQTPGHPAACVNFDSANTLLYGKGGPIEAIHVPAPWIRQFRVKEAIPSATPGTWGEEVAAGTGQVDSPAFFSTLAETGFAGDIVIERGTGEPSIRAGTSVNLHPDP